MAIKILILSASPRKGGNSDLLCDEFLRGAREAGHGAEKIFLREKKTGYCVACDVCRKNGGKCFQKDDMGEILEKMITADAIVMATPVYFYTMNAQLKTLIDRVYPKYTEVSDKDFYFIMTAADGAKGATEATLQGFRAFTSCLTGAKEKGVLAAGGVWNAGDVKGTAAMAQAYELGKKA